MRARSVALVAALVLGGAGMVTAQDVAPLPGRTFEPRDRATTLGTTIRLTDGVLSGSPY